MSLLVSFYHVEVCLKYNYSVPELDKDSGEHLDLYAPTVQPATTGLKKRRTKNPGLLELTEAEHRLQDGAVYEGSAEKVACSLRVSQLPETWSDLLDPASGRLM